MQAELSADEALVAWTVGVDESYVFVGRKNGATFFRAPLKGKDVAEIVKVLRKSLDPHGQRAVKSAPFDVAKAYILYQQFLAPAEPLLTGAKSLIIVSDGALQSLPPSVLVTEAPHGSTAKVADAHDYKKVAWLARRYALAILPAVSSLISLRLFAEAHHADKPFVGFGDPDFKGGKTEGLQVRGVRPASLFRGGAANLDGLHQLRPLPETADELKAEARALGAPRSSVYIGKNATVTKVKSLDLSDARVVAFATHGLVAGEFPKLAEPALALTPPSIPREDDDGLLRASEVSQLKLNADWVVLSACNTAAADGTPGAEGLSGLAKAFFHAGARSLLVSHWPVDSAATVKLTTGAFNALRSDPAIGRAEAFRRAMLALIDGADKSPDAASEAHPLYWAPFVVVGEGGSGK